MEASAEIPDHTLHRNCPPFPLGSFKEKHEDGNLLSLEGPPAARSDPSLRSHQRRFALVTGHASCFFSGLSGLASADTAASIVEVLTESDRVAGDVHFWFFSGPLCTGACSVSSSEPILVLALFASLSAKLWVLVLSPSPKEIGLSLLNPSKQQTNVPAKKGKGQNYKNYREP